VKERGRDGETKEEKRLARLRAHAHSLVHSLARTERVGMQEGVPTRGMENGCGGGGGSGGGGGK